MMKGQRSQTPPASTIPGGGHWTEDADGDVVMGNITFQRGFKVERHKHSRAQFLCARGGVALVRTPLGHWIVPSGQAIWIPANLVHAVEMLTDIRMQSAYVKPDRLVSMPATLAVLRVTPLLRHVMHEAAELPHSDAPAGRQRLLLELILAEIPRMEALPLGLPFPRAENLSQLCRDFLENPTAHVTIDEWAGASGMSRRSFTRRFQRETGLSLSVWRQQASLFAALPRLTAGDSVTRVAFDLGYESVAAFTTMFRRRLGMSPRAYLKAETVRTGPN